MISCSHWLRVRAKVHGFTSVPAALCDMDGNAGNFDPGLMWQRAGLNVLLAAFVAERVPDIGETPVRRLGIA